MNKRLRCLIFCFAIFAVLDLQSAERLELVILEPNEQVAEILLFSAANEVKTEHLRIAGIFNEKNFSIQDHTKITVEDSNGKRYPLLISKDGLLTEFNEIVSLWFSFDIPRQYIDNGGVLFLLWGDEIKADNLLTERVGVQPNSKQYLKTFSWKKSALISEHANFATIEVIADSRADYFFLWYLLPMAVIFAVLALRKSKTAKI